jgi:hypothetical protein
LGDPRGKKREGNKPEEDGEDIEGEDGPVVVYCWENETSDDGIYGYDYCC